MRVCVHVCVFHLDKLKAKKQQQRSLGMIKHIYTHTHTHTLAYTTEMAERMKLLEGGVGYKRGGGVLLQILCNI